MLPVSAQYLPELGIPAIDRFVIEVTDEQSDEDRVAPGITGELSP